MASTGQGSPSVVRFVEISVVTSQLCAWSWKYIGLCFGNLCNEQYTIYRNMHNLGEHGLFSIYHFEMLQSLTTLYQIPSDTWILQLWLTFSPNDFHFQYFSFSDICMFMKTKSSEFLKEQYCMKYTHRVPNNGNAAEKKIHHYGDVIMTTIASQITSLTGVYSIVYSDADQRKHQSSASLAFVWGIHRGPVNSPHKWPVRRKMFSFDDVIMNLPET